MLDYCQLLVSNFNRLAKTTTIPKTHWYFVHKYQRNSSMNKVTSLLRSFLNIFTITSNYSKTNSYHYAKSVRIRSYSGRYFATLGLNTERSLRISPYSVQMRENTDQNNSKYGHFSRSVSLEPHGRCYIACWRIFGYLPSFTLKLKKLPSVPS